MTSFWWLLLVGAALSHMGRTQEQPLPDEENQTEDSPDMSTILQRAQGALVRNILRRMEDGEQSERDAETPTLDWIYKRQHPGKRVLEDLEKRQHPGKREEAEWYLDLPKRQYTGMWTPLAAKFLDNPSTPFLGLLSEVSKRQHPGKRSLSYIKRQHPGKRVLEEDDNTELGDPQDMEKRQHPGKRYLEPENQDYLSPCEGPDPINCSKGSIIRELLDNVSRGRLEEKRQHPGRRATWEDITATEE